MVRSTFLQDCYDIDALVYNDIQAFISRISFIQDHETQMRESLLIDAYS